ncbi:MAG: oligosaccharide flippase family protein [Candidatus Curtissbacteria bacterium]
MAKNFVNSKVETISSYLGLDLAYFVGGGFWLGLSMVLTTIGGILLSALFARVWPKEVYGQFSFLMSALGLVSLVALPGMYQAVLQAAAENKDGVYRQVIKSVAKWALLGAIALILGSVYFYFNNNQSLSLAFLVSAIAFPLSAGFNLYNPFLTGKKRFRKVAIYTTVAQFTSIGATALALWQFPSLVLVALFSSWSTALINIILTIFSFREVGNNNHDESLMRLGKHLSFSQVFTIGADYLDRFLVPVLLGFTNNAIYAFAILIPMQIHGLLKIFTTLGQPKVAEISQKNLKGGLIRKSLQMEVVVLVVVFFYILAAPSIFKILYPGYGSDVVFLSQIFSLSLLYFPGNILSLSFIKARDTKAIYQMNATYALITVISLVVLVPVFGLIGVVAAKVIARFAQLATQIYLFKKSTVAEN